MRYICVEYVFGVYIILPLLSHKYAWSNQTGYNCFFNGRLLVSLRMYVCSVKILTSKNDHILFRLEQKNRYTNSACKWYMNLNVYRLHKLHDNNILLCITKKNQIMRSNYETWNVKHNTPDDIIRNRFSKFLSWNWFCFCAFLAMYLYESMLNFEIYQILWCQNVYGFVVPSIIFQLINIFFRLQPVEQILSFFSVFTKMATVFSYVFPLLYLHSPEFYIRTLLTSIGSNILTILLKWLVPHYTNDL